MGCPKEGASDSRTLRGITTRQTRSEKCSRDLVGHVDREPGPGVVHGQHDGRDLERLVQVGRDQVHVAQELAQTLEGVVLALNGDEHLVRRGQAVDRDEAEGGRAVDEDEVEVVDDRVDAPA